MISTVRLSSKLRVFHDAFSIEGFGMSCLTLRPSYVFIVSSMEFIISEAVCIFPTLCGSFADGKHLDSHVETALLHALHDDGRYTQVFTLALAVTHSLLCAKYTMEIPTCKATLKSAPWRSSWPPSHASGRLPIFAHRRDHHGHAITSPRRRDRSRNCSASDRMGP